MNPAFEHALCCTRCQQREVFDRGQPFSGGWGWVVMQQQDRSQPKQVFTLCPVCFEVVQALAAGRIVAGPAVTPPWRR